MSARHRKPPKRPSPPKQLTKIFGRFSRQDIERWAAWGEEGRRFHWKWYSDLAYQRSKITTQLHAALLGAAQPFEFQGWQRVGSYKYALQPLSVQGSLKRAGRFNVANLDPVRFPPFPALYLASDRETALQEVLAQDASTQGELSPYEFALARPDAIFSVPVRGALKSVINLGKPEKLDAFIALIKDFKIDPDTIRMARLNSMPEPTLIKTTAVLLTAMTLPQWREWPALFGVPNSSQIFGQLTLSAGIEGIVYPSKFNGRDNLAVFPQALAGASYVELADHAPEEVKVRRLDASMSKILH